MLAQTRLSRNTWAVVYFFFFHWIAGKKKCESKSIALQMQMSPKIFLNTHQMQWDTNGAQLALNDQPNFNLVRFNCYCDVVRVYWRVERCRVIKVMLSGWMVLRKHFEPNRCSCSQWLATNLRRNHKAMEISRKWTNRQPYSKTMKWMM